MGLSEARHDGACFLEFDRLHEGEKRWRLLLSLDPCSSETAIFVACFLAIRITRVYQVLGAKTYSMLGNEENADSVFFFLSFFHLHSISD